MKLEKVPYNPEFYPGFEYRKIDIILGDQGEGVWCLLAPKDLTLYDSNSTTQSHAILCNDSVLYPGLVAGQIVPIQFNGEFRASVISDWLELKSWLDS